MIKTIKELKEYLGKNHTIAYASKLAIFARVDGVLITLPTSKETLEKRLNKAQILNYDIIFS